MQVVEYVEIKVGGCKVKLKVEKQLNIVKVTKLQRNWITSCVEDGGDKDGENADDDDTGTETGEGDVGDKGGEIQT